jgi:hypothetical protein
VTAQNRPDRERRPIALTFATALQLALRLRRPLVLQIDVEPIPDLVYRRRRPDLTWLELKGWSREQLSARAQEGVRLAIVMEALDVGYLELVDRFPHIHLIDQLTGHTDEAGRRARARHIRRRVERAEREVRARQKR